MNFRVKWTYIQYFKLSKKHVFIMDIKLRNIKSQMEAVFVLKTSIRMDMNNAY